MFTEPPEGFTWAQKDAMELYCETCGNPVRAELVDVHARRCGR